MTPLSPSAGQTRNPFRSSSGSTEQGKRNSSTRGNSTGSAVFKSASRRVAKARKTPGNLRPSVVPGNKVRAEGGTYGTYS